MNNHLHRRLSPIEIMDRAERRRGLCTLLFWSAVLVAGCVCVWFAIHY